MAVDLYEMNRAMGNIISGKVQKKHTHTEKPTTPRNGKQCDIKIKLRFIKPQ